MSGRKSLVVSAFVLLLFAGCSFTHNLPGSGITLEVAVFEGGYGIEWHKSVAREYEKLHPDIHINLWGDPRVDEKLKPRILRRDPPEIANSNLPVWKLIIAGKLYPLDQALGSPAYGQNCTWQQSLTPGVLSDFSYRGHIYAMPTNLNAWVCWYDKRQFRLHGWQPPHTWNEFLALCKQMKSAGIAPLAFQGKYPQYAWSTLLSIYQRLVPFEEWYQIEDLKRGAFLDPEFVHAARLMQELGTNYFQEGCMAMTHTESQMEWVNGRAAMVFCGLWLKNEMKAAIPQGFEMSCFPVPVIEGGKGDPHAIYGGGAENCFVFRESKHPQEALDFLKYMESLPSARTYCTRLDTLAPVKGAVNGLQVSSALQSAVDIVNSSTRIFQDRLTGLYLEFGQTVVHDNLARLVSAKISPEDFAHNLELGAERIREDPDIYKPAPTGVPSLK
jgi:ABC-type glycerol-3-phosphate transport system substrate-binding protein